MRIVAGIAKNRKIKSKKGNSTRPTMERVKEAIYSILEPYIDQSCFLDLFSGTGNMALEAVSRGSKRAVMIEDDVEALRIIIENVNSLGFEDRCRAYKNDVFRAIEILSKKGEKFDIIFMDPPYKQELCTRVIKLISKKGILAEGGIIVAEHHFKEDLADEVGEFKKIDERDYGGKQITFFSR